MRGILTFLVLLLVIGSVHAETDTTGSKSRGIFSPGSRAGLSLRVDVGGGDCTVDAESASWEPNKLTNTSSGVGTVMSMGLGFNEHFIISFSLRMFAFGDDVGWAFILGPLSPIFLDMHTFSGVGFIYYLRDRSPSLFVEAGLGGSTLSNPFDDTNFLTEDRSGTGYYVGGGYEFAKHLHFTLQYWWTDIGGADSLFDGKWSGNTLILTIGVNLY